MMRTDAGDLRGKSRMFRALLVSAPLALAWGMEDAPALTPHALQTSTTVLSTVERSMIAKDKNGAAHLVGPAVAWAEEMLGEAKLVQTGSHISSEAGILPNEAANQAERMLRDLEATKGFGVHVFVVRQVSPGMTPIDVAKETYESAGYGPKDVVVVLNAKTARGGVFAGADARALLSEDVAKSIAEETFLFRAREEKFGAALVDVADRMTKILSGSGDPGPPRVKERKMQATYRKKEETKKERKKYVAVVLTLLVISVVAPMVQYFWYLRR